ncbi:TOBE domain-containing protein [Microbacterium album]|uniref:MerR family transcriptional regulator n=1 Tax=Microbacterium album TaxID=2053191 RepID=A0A917ICF5_9MICO|nr:TOBE domain-containing protein [Microbacterium album]GGH34350.1 MerR family transcriptional regulator [Microbacterium album]
MTQIRISEAAAFLGVSDDTVRRWTEQGVLEATVDARGRKVVDGLALARFARERASAPADPLGEVATSARNRFVGLVTHVVSDRVMSQVELQCGPHRVVSLMSTEAVKELGIEPGTVAVASVKATQVTVEVARDRTP